MKFNIEEIKHGFVKEVKNGAGFKGQKENVTRFSLDFSCLEYTKLIRGLSPFNGKPVNEIKNDDGNVVVRLHGDLNIEAFARGLLGMKQA